jgi:hypothetical protein
MPCDPAIRAHQISKVFALRLTARKDSLVTTAENSTRMIPLEAALERFAQKKVEIDLPSLPLTPGVHYMNDGLFLVPQDWEIRPSVPDRAPGDALQRR